MALRHFPLMRKTRTAYGLLCLFAVALLSACPDVKTAGAPCPCAEGWTCCTDQDLCVENESECRLVESGEDGGTVDGDVPDSGSNFDAASVENCSADGTQFSIEGAGFSVTSSVAEIWDGGGGVVGATGATDAGRHFWFRRDGDFGDGEFDNVQTYDVSNYPYNINYFDAPGGSDCSEGFGGVCVGFHAKGGTLTVTKIAPYFEATFAFSSLFEDDFDGAPIAGTVTGCIALPNP